MDDIHATDTTKFVYVTRLGNEIGFIYSQAHYHCRPDLVTCIVVICTGVAQIGGVSKLEIGVLLGPGTVRTLSASAPRWRLRLLKYLLSRVPWSSVAKFPVIVVVQ